MVITSTDNEKVKDVVKLLTDKKYRKQTGRYVIEGSRLVADAFKSYEEVVAVFVSESQQNVYNYDNQVVVSDKVFAKMSDTVNSQGILAVAVRREERYTARHNALILDGLQDPGNVGTLLRTAVACEFFDIYAVNTVDLYSPKVLRSAMSAHFSLNLFERERSDMDSIFEDLCGYEVIACDMNGENVFQHKFRGTKVALILGNEGNGLSEYTRKNVPNVVSLPMNNNIESLNVAVAGSVIMYQVFSKLFK